MEIRIRLPRIGGELISNLLGLAELAGLVAAVGGLTGNPWWSVLTAGVLLVGLSYVAHATTAVGQAPAKASAPPAAASLQPERRVA